MDDLLLALEVANETDTNLELRNIAILMFAERPDKLISGAQINLVRFNTKEIGLVKYRINNRFFQCIIRIIHAFYRFLLILNFDSLLNYNICFYII